MATVYEIEGDLVRRVERQITAVATVTDMLPTLLTYHPITMGRLPKHTVFLKARPNASNQTLVDLNIIVQQPPEPRTILFNESGGDIETQTAYRIAMPYHSFWFKMRGSPMTIDGDASLLWTPSTWGIFWSKAPFTSTEDPAISARMPNSWGDTRVCFGNNPIPATASLGDHIDHLTNTYWSSVFNTDLDMNLPYAGRPRTALRAWQTATERNVDVWLSWDIWDNAPSSNELIANVTGYDAFMQPAPDSTEAVVPQPPVERTFYALDRWVQESLDDGQRERLLAILQP